MAPGRAARPSRRNRAAGGAAAQRPPPPYDWLAPKLPGVLNQHLGPFPGGAPVRARERPSHLEDSGGTLNRFDAQVLGERLPPRDVRVTSLVELVNRLVKEALFGFVETLVVREKRLRRLVPQVSSASRKSLTLSNRTVRPAAMSASASRSIACQRSVQNHCWSAGTGTTGRITKTPSSSSVTSSCIPGTPAMSRLRKSAGKATTPRDWKVRKP